MTIKFLSVEYYRQNESTIYWFAVGDQKYGLRDCNGSTDLLDYYGYPIDLCNDHDRVLDAILKKYPNYWRLS